MCHGSGQRWRVLPRCEACSTQRRNLRAALLMPEVAAAGSAGPNQTVVAVTPVVEHHLAQQDLEIEHIAEEPPQRGRHVGL